jgi:orotidine-5'-phosphate decarboxylase
LGYAWERLTSATQATGAALCVGIDPHPSLFPTFMAAAEDPLQSFGTTVVEATQGLAAAYKFNVAFFEAAGPAAIASLRGLVRSVAGGPALAIVDAKRGDVGHTSRAYAAALFDELGADAVTVNPYVGYDGIEPFLARQGKGVFVLCRTSNPGAADFQQLQCVVDGEAVPLYLAVARKVAEWNRTHGNCGLVVGATAPSETAAVRSVVGALPLLLPGVGAQGGNLGDAVRAAQGGPFLINVSRGLIPDGSLAKGEWHDSLRSKAEQYLDAIRAVRIEKTTP